MCFFRPKLDDVRDEHARQMQAFSTNPLLRRESEPTDRAVAHGERELVVRRVQGAPERADRGLYFQFETRMTVSANGRCRPPRPEADVSRFEESHCESDSDGDGDSSAIAIAIAARVSIILFHSFTSNGSIEVVSRE
jgi:hypothetical protein